MDLSLIDEWAARHHGVITLERVLKLGVSGRAWYRAIAAGQLVQLHPGVARVHGSPSTFEQRAFAAVASAGTGAVASHRTAARLLGVARPAADPIDLIVTGRRGLALEGVEVHRPSDRADLTAVVRQHVRCTNQLRTLVDLGAVVDHAMEVAEALETFVVSGAIKPAVVLSILAEHGRKGRHGVGALRAVIADWPLADHVPDSVLETAMARLLRDHHLPAAEFHARVAGFEVDFLVIGAPVVIECDGWQFHVADRHRWERDKRRDATLAAEGYVVVRLTWNLIIGRPGETAARVRAVIERWAPHLLAA